MTRPLPRRYAAVTLRSGAHIDGIVARIRPTHLAIVNDGVTRYVDVADIETLETR